MASILLIQKIHTDVKIGGKDDPKNIRYLQAAGKHGNAQIGNSAPNYKIKKHENSEKCKKRRA